MSYSSLLQIRLFFIPISLSQNNHNQETVVSLSSLSLLSLIFPAVPSLSVSLSLPPSKLLPPPLSLLSPLPQITLTHTQSHIFCNNEPSVQYCTPITHKLKAKPSKSQQYRLRSHKSHGELFKWQFLITAHWP